MLKINKNKGKVFRFATHVNEFLVPREKTSSSETFLVVIEPNKSTHLHKHEEMEQTFYVTKGKGEVWTVSDAKHRLARDCRIRRGDVLFIPVDTWHQVKCKSKGSLEYICFNAFPRGFPRKEKSSLAHARKVVQRQKVQERKLDRPGMK